MSSWRQIHIHTLDEWIGNIEMVSWRWKTTRNSTYIRSPNNSIHICDYPLRTPGDVKHHIEYKILKKPPPKIVVKHTDVDTINFLVLAQMLHKLSPIYYNDYLIVFSQKKIDIKLITKVHYILLKMELISPYERNEHKGWINDGWTVKDPRSLFVN